MQGRLGNVVFFWVAILKFQLLYEGKREVGGGGAVFATCGDKVKEKELHVCRFASALCHDRSARDDWRGRQSSECPFQRFRVYLCSVGALKVLSQELAPVVTQT